MSAQGICEGWDARAFLDEQERAWLAVRHYVAHHIEQEIVVPAIVKLREHRDALARVTPIGEQNA